MITHLTMLLMYPFFSCAVSSLVADTKVLKGQILKLRRNFEKDEGSKDEDRMRELESQIEAHRIRAEEEKERIKKEIAEYWAPKREERMKILSQQRQIEAEILKLRIAADDKRQTTSLSREERTKAEDRMKELRRIAESEKKKWLKAEKTKERADVMSGVSGRSAKCDGPSAQREDSMKELQDGQSQPQVPKDQAMAAIPPEGAACVTRDDGAPPEGEDKIKALEEKFEELAVKIAALDKEMEERNKRDSREELKNLADKQQKDNRLREETKELERLKVKMGADGAEKAKEAKEATTSFFLPILLQTLCGLPNVTSVFTTVSFSMDAFCFMHEPYPPPLFHRLPISLVLTLVAWKAKAH